LPLRAAAKTHGGEDMLAVIPADYEARNLVSCRKTVKSSDDLRVMIDDLNNYVESMGASRTGSMISITYSNEEESGNQDIKVMMPVNKEIPSMDDFVFTPRFRAVNCLMSKHRKGDRAIEDVYTVLRREFDEMGLPMNPPYYHVYSLDSEDDTYEVQVYAEIWPMY